VELNPDFLSLWNKISQKTRYAIAFDTQKLIDLASHKLQTMPLVQPVSLVVDHTQASLTQAGVGVERKIQTPKARYVTTHSELPDLLGALQEQTELTRATLLAIIKRCGRLQEFKNNPQGFISEAGTG